MPESILALHKVAIQLGALPMERLRIDSLEDQLADYSNISKAALKKAPTVGAAMAALAIGTTESEAAIVVTNVNQTLGSGLPTGGNSVFILDIVGYGVFSQDFAFQAVNGATQDFLAMGQASGNRIVGRNSAYGGFYASRLASGVSVGPTQAFVPTGTTINKYLAFATGGGSFGEWAGGQTGFVGIRVGGAGTVNYGWIEITTDANNFGATIHRYAIETSPNTAIAAGATGGPAVPEPNSLACLAVGAAGLLTWRRRRKRHQAA